MPLVIVPSPLLPTAAFATLSGVTCEGETATIVGTNGNNDITGTSGDDVIAALGGNDRIRAQGGDDLVCG
jgi:Ca2+-binding RTX toxin-like protein